MSTTITRQSWSAAELLALALEHRIQAEQCDCPAEQIQLHRVADIYTALATIDIPATILARTAQ